MNTWIHLGPGRARGARRSSVLAALAAALIALIAAPAGADGYRVLHVGADGVARETAHRSAGASTDAAPGGGSAEAAGAMHVADLAVDVDFPYYQRWGDQTEARVTAILEAVNAQYERDVAIRHRISAIIIRTTPTYTSSNVQTLLAQFRAQWLANHQDIERDLAHLFTGRNLDGGVVGAALLGDGVCSDDAFCLAADFTAQFECLTDLSARELGYLWGARICSCPGTTMHSVPSCANAFGAESIEQIVAHRDSRDCLDVEGDECPLDIDGNGRADFGDLVAILASWGPCEGCPEDLDRSGVVDFADLVMLLAGWGGC